VNWIDLFNNLTSVTNNKVCQNGGFFTMDKKIYQKIFNDIDKSLQFDKEDIVLDIGCGNGEITKFIAPRVKEVILVDGAAKMLEFAHKATQNFENTEFKIIDLNKPLNISELGAFDKIFCYSVVQYLDDYQKFENLLREMVRALKPGGKILVGDIPLADKREKYLRERRKKPLINLFGNLKHFFKKTITSLIVNNIGKNVEARGVIYSNRDIINQSIISLNEKNVNSIWVEQDKKLLFSVSREDLLIFKK